MEEILYKVEELGTTGWFPVQENLSRDEANQLLNSLIENGTNPNYLRALKHEN